jgi:hypothetical protein
MNTLSTCTISVFAWEMVRYLYQWTPCLSVQSVCVCLGDGKIFIPMNTLSTCTISVYINQDYFCPFIYTGRSRDGRDFDSESRLPKQQRHRWLFNGGQSILAIVTILSLLLFGICFILQQHWKYSFAQLQILSVFVQIWHKVVSATLECVRLEAKFACQKYANTLKVVIHLGVAL